MDQGSNDAAAAVSAVVSAAAPIRTDADSSLVCKRGLDVVLAAVACCVLLPLFVLTALALLVAQGRPIFVAHRRVGRGGKRFHCLKFRTMVVDADRVLAEHLERCPQARTEWRLARKLQKDPRVTPLGASLRSSSVDELPQLINVLRGDMSLVGPRPIVEDELKLYGAYVHKYLKARPGLTGAWQVSGRSKTTFADRVRLDVDYVDHRDLVTDVGIILRTIPAVLLSKGAV